MNKYSVIQKNIKKISVSYIGSLSKLWSNYWIKNPPSNLVVVWVNDYAQMTWDIGESAGQYEIWESLNGGAYYLSYTTSTGSSSYNNYTWQNATMKFKVRGVGNGFYSAFTNEVILVTPLVFRANQSILTQVYIKTISMATPGKLMVIKWGDGEITNVSSTLNTTYTHDYLGTGLYWIHFTGDVNYIAQFEFYSQSVYLSGTNISKWKLPALLTLGHFYDNDLIGDITDIEYPNTCIGCHFGGNNITADITDWSFPVNFIDIHINSNIGGITGNISLWSLGIKIAHFEVRGNVTGDLTSVIPWVAPTYGTIILYLQSTSVIGFTGDLSGWIIPNKPANLNALVDCHFTKLPRGNFAKVSNYEFTGNSCNQAELDDLLDYIDDYFTGGIIPEVNCIYRLGGAGMGIPSAAGMASRASIIAKYIAAGKTITIIVNV